MKLDAYISELLQDHDCVIVPEFGGFVANYAPAKINPVNNRFDPPFRKITFNQFLVHNDGLLAAYIAQKEAENYEEALRFVKDYVVLIKKELNNEHKTQIENVGVLYRQSDGSLRFEQIKNEAHFKAGFGLDSFFSQKVERKPAKVDVVEPKSAPIKEVEPKVISIQKTEPETEAPIEEPITEEKRRRVWPAVAAAISLPLVGYLAYVAMATPLLKDRTQFHYSDLNPFTEKICPEYKLRTQGFSSEVIEDFESIDTEVAGEFLELNVDTSPDKTMVVRLVEPKAKVESFETLRYHVVGGCFGVESNATGLVNKYKTIGTNANIIDQKGSLYRVSVASYATRQEALSALAKYRSDIPGAWLLYK